MTRIPRVRLIFVIATLLVLLAVPMAGARTLNAPSIHSADAGWLGAALRWVAGFTGFEQAGHRPGRVSQAPAAQKDTQAATPQGGGCILPDGRPRPICI